MNDAGRRYRLDDKTFRVAGNEVKVVAESANRIWIMVQWMPQECKKSDLIVAEPLIAGASCRVSRIPVKENATSIS